VTGAELRDALRRYMRERKPEIGLTVTVQEMGDALRQVFREHGFVERTRGGATPGLTAESVAKLPPHGRNV
jgi:hypothetical protein